jgi:repressor of nif and glnA expression
MNADEEKERIIKFNYWSQFERVYNCGSVLLFISLMESTNFESNFDATKEKIESVYESSNILSRQEQQEGELIDFAQSVSNV